MLYENPLYLINYNFTKSYKWIVCPFQNVTQFEQNIRWNPYKGILGIFYEWEIIDNTFNALLMKNGDDCGTHGNRETKVIFECNRLKNSNKTEIDSVSETRTCKYEVVLKTNLVCNQTNLEMDYIEYDEEDKDEEILPMNVYPHLNSTLQDQWDIVYTDFVNKLITEKVNYY